MLESLRLAVRICLAIGGRGTIDISGITGLGNASIVAAADIVTECSGSGTIGIFCAISGQGTISGGGITRNGRTGVIGITHIVIEGGH